MKYVVIMLWKAAVKSHICFVFFTRSSSTAKIVTGTVKNGALKWNNEDVASASFATHPNRDRPEEQRGFYVRRGIRVEIARKNTEVFMSDALWLLSTFLHFGSEDFFLKVVVMVEELKTGAAGADTREQNWTAADTLEWLKYHLWLFLKNFCCIIFFWKYLFNSFFSKQHVSFGGLQSFGNINFNSIGRIPVVVNNSSYFICKNICFF